MKKSKIKDTSVGKRLIESINLLFEILIENSVSWKFQNFFSLKGISQYYANHNIMVTCLRFDWSSAITSSWFDWSNGIFIFVFVIINKPKKKFATKVWKAIKYISWIFSSVLYHSCKREIFVLIHQNSFTKYNVSL